jgi:hypothetical protein
VHFKADFDNDTGGTYLSVNGLNPIFIKKGIVNNLDSNDIKTGQIVDVIYNGLYFLIQGVNYVDVINSKRTSNTLLYLNRGF